MHSAPSLSQPVYSFRLVSSRYRDSHLAQSIGSDRPVSAFFCISLAPDLPEGTVGLVCQGLSCLSPAKPRLSCGSGKQGLGVRGQGHRATYGRHKGVHRIYLILFSLLLPKSLLLSPLTRPLTPDPC